MWSVVSDAASRKLDYSIITPIDRLWLSIAATVKLSQSNPNTVVEDILTFNIDRPDLYRELYALLLSLTALYIVEFWNPCEWTIILLYFSIIIIVQAEIRRIFLLLDIRKRIGV